MELKEYLQIIKKRLWLVIILPVIAALITFSVCSYYMEPVFEAKASLLVGIIPFDQEYQMSYDDILMYEQLIKTYSELTQSKLVAKETLSRLNNGMTLEELQSSITVTNKADSQIIEVTAQDTDPKMAADIANTLSQVFIEKVDSLMNSDDTKFMDRADIPIEPAKPRVMLNTAIAFFLGLMMSLGIIFLREYLDNTLKTENDIERYLAVTVLANVPYVKGRKNNPEVKL